MKGKDAKASFNFGYDYRRPYFSKYIKVNNRETQREVREEEEQEESAERALWEQAGMAGRCDKHAAAENMLEWPEMLSI